MKKYIDSFFNREKENTKLLTMMIVCGESRKSLSASVIETLIGEEESEYQRRRRRNRERQRKLEFQTKQPERMHPNFYLLLFFPENTEA